MASIRKRYKFFDYNDIHNQISVVVDRETWIIGLDDLEELLEEKQLKRLRNLYPDEKTTTTIKGDFRKWLITKYGC